MGLCTKLSGVHSFDEALELAEKGSQAHCDITSNDMLGDELCARMLELSGSQISLFGAIRRAQPASRQHISRGR